MSNRKSIKRHNPVKKIEHGQLHTKNMRHEPKKFKSPFRKPWGAPSGGRGGVGGAGWEQGGGVGRERA